MVDTARGVILGPACEPHAVSRKQTLTALQAGFVVCSLLLEVLCCHYYFYFFYYYNHCDYYYYYYYHYHYHYYYYYCYYYYYLDPKLGKGTPTPFPGLIDPLHGTARLRATSPGAFWGFVGV